MALTRTLAGTLAFLGTSAVALEANPSANVDGGGGTTSGAAKAGAVNGAGEATAGATDAGAPGGSPTEDDGEAVRALKRAHEILKVEMAGIAAAAEAAPGQQGGSAVSNLTGGERRGVGEVRAQTAKVLDTLSEAYAGKSRWEHARCENLGESEQGGQRDHIRRFAAKAWSSLKRFAGRFLECTLCAALLSWHATPWARSPGQPQNSPSRPGAASETAAGRAPPQACCRWGTSCFSCTGSALGLRRPGACGRFACRICRPEVEKTDTKHVVQQLALLSLRLSLAPHACEFGEDRESHVV